MPFPGLRMAAIAVHGQGTLPLQFCGFGALRNAMEQRRAGLAFQVLDLLAERLADANARGGASEIVRAPAEKSFRGFFALTERFWPRCLRLRGGGSRGDALRRGECKP